MANQYALSGELVTPRAHRASALPRHVVIIYSVVESWDRGVEYEHIADAETAEIAQATLDALTPHFVSVAIHPIRVLDDVIRGLSGCDPTETVVFNLVEALGPTSGPEAQVPRFLDR